MYHTLNIIRGQTLTSSIHKINKLCLLGKFSQLVLHVIFISSISLYILERCYIDKRMENAQDASIIENNGLLTMSGYRSQGMRAWYIHIY